MGNVEALALYRRIGVECHVQSVAGGHDWTRQTAATQPAQLASTRVVSVEDFQTIVRAFHVRLQLKVIERLRVYYREPLLSHDRHISALIHRSLTGCYNLATGCYH